MCNVKQLIIILITVISGCNTHKDLEFPLTVGGDPKLSQLTRESVSWWNVEIYVHYLTYCETNEIADCDDFPMIFTNSRDPMVKVRESRTLGRERGYSGYTELYEYTYKQSCDVYLDSRYKTVNVATHELGHCLGLRDVYTRSESDNVMYGYSNNNNLKLSYNQAKIILDKYFKSEK